MNIVSTLVWPAEKFIKKLLNKFCLYLINLSYIYCCDFNKLWLSLVQNFGTIFLSSNFMRWHLAWLSMSLFLFSNSLMQIFMMYIKQGAINRKSFFYTLSLCLINLAIVQRWIFFLWIKCGFQSVFDTVYVLNVVYWSLEIMDFYTHY